MSTKVNIIILLILVFEFLRRKRKKLKYAEIITQILYFICTMLIISMAGRKYGHYAMILIPCYIVPITLIMKYIMELKSEKIQILFILVFTVVVGLAELKEVYNHMNIVSYAVYPNAYDEEIVKYIKANSNENDNVLMLENVCFLYNLSNRKYDGKYAYQYPIILVDNKIYNEIMEEIEENKPDLVIYYHGVEKFEQLINSGYEPYVNLINFYKIFENMTEEGIYTRYDKDGFVAWSLNKR